MASLLENYGLENFLEDEESLTSLIAFNTEKAKPINRYYEGPYLINYFGAMDFLLRTEKQDDGVMQVCGFDTHCGNKCIWEMVHSGIDITREEDKKFKRTILLNKYDSQSGLLPVELITADVLPSFMEGDKIKVQMVGLPIRVAYYTDMESYCEAQPGNDKGEKYCLDEGALIPLAFLYNHSREKYEQGKYYETDRYVEFVGTVKKLVPGILDVDGELSNTFVRCFVDTKFGEIEFDHTIDMVEEKQQENIKVGAVICGSCILSGDVAIHEYEKGIVKDFDHNLRLLRYTLVEGDAERLSKVLDENAVYETVHYDRPFTGAREIIDRFKYVQSHRSSEYAAHLATITEADSPELDYPVGTRCIILADGDPDNFESIVFMDVNDDGMITKIKVSTDSRYRFDVDMTVVTIVEEEDDEDGTN